MNEKLIDQIYSKNKEVRKEDVENLMNWIDGQPHLPKVSELQVIHFLHSCYYSSEMTKKTIDCYFTIKTDLFPQRDPRSENLKNAQNVGLYKVMPGTTTEGYKVLLCKLVDKDPKKYVFADQLNLMDMQYTLWLHQTEELAKGFLILCDLDGLSMSYMAKFNLTVMRRFSLYLEQAMPIRLKGIHFVNIVPIMDMFMNLVRPFVKKEIMDGIHMHTDPKTLLQHFTNENLPNEFGGTAGTFQELTEQQINEQTGNHQLFLKLDEQIVDESKRPASSKPASSDIFGTEGTFKRLDID